MELSYGQLEATLAMHLGIHPDRVTTFRARIKQLLQRYHFPPGSNVGRGEKMRYSATHLFQLVAVFEMINAGMPAGSATEIVESKWRNFACGFGLAVRHRQRKEFAQLVFIRVMNSTLVELQGHRDRAEIPNVYVEDETSLARILKRNEDRIANSYLILCATDVVFSTVDALKRAGRIDNPLSKIDVAGWQVHGTAEEATWMRAEDGWRGTAFPESLLPDFLGQIALRIIETYPEIAVKFLREAEGADLSKDEGAILSEMGLWSDDFLNDRGRAIARFIHKDDGDDLDP